MHCTFWPQFHKISKMKCKSMHDSIVNHHLSLLEINGGQWLFSSKNCKRGDVLKRVCQIIDGQTNCKWITMINSLTIESTLEEGNWDFWTINIAAIWSGKTSNSIGELCGFYMSSFISWAYFRCSVVFICYMCAELYQVVTKWWGQKPEQETCTSAMPPRSSEEILECYQPSWEI